MKKSLILFLVFISCGSIEYEETLNESSETAESTTTTVSPSTTTTTVSPSTTTTTVSPSTTTTTVSPSTTTTTVSPCSQNTNGPDYTNATLSSSVVDVSVSSMNLTVTVDVFDECAVPNNPVMTIVDNNNTIVTGKESQLISGTLTDGTFGYIFDINSSSYPSGSYSVVINGNNDLNRQANEIILVFEVINNPPTTTTTTTTIPIAQYPQLTSFNISGPSESTYGEDITYSFSFTIDPAGQTLDSNYLRFTFARVGTNSGNIGCINSSLTANSSSLFSGSGTCIVNWSDSTNVNTNFRLYKVVIKLSNSNLFTQYENTGYVYENISSSNMKSYQHNFFDSEVITTITP